MKTELHQRDGKCNKVPNGSHRAENIVTEMKNIITKLQNTLEGLNSRGYETEERLIQPEDKAVGHIQSEQKQGKRMKTA